MRQMTVARADVSDPPWPPTEPGTSKSAFASVALAAAAWGFYETPQRGRFVPLVLPLVLVVLAFGFAGFAHVDSKARHAPAWQSMLA